MSKTNVAPIHPTTHEGGRAAIIRPEQELRRSIMSCLLWEDTFYEDGQNITDRIAQFSARVSISQVCEIAIEARTKIYLRHVPLWLMTSLLPRRGGNVVGNTIAEIIQRADELAELLAMYWKDGKKPLPKQLKRGIALAFPKFNAYQLAKYNRDGVVKLRDALFLTHPKPKDIAQAETWKQLTEGTLQAPDTWEVRLSGGQDKKVVFERLLRENKLGYLALLRNLRNMATAGVDESLVIAALRKGAVGSKVLPFRFVAAARAVPTWEQYLDEAMLLSIEEQDKLPGKTAILVDVSNSMEDTLSAKSDLSRMDAAAALTVLVREIAEAVDIFTFSDTISRVPARRGMALIDAIQRSQEHRNTYLGKAITALNANVAYDRLIVITDEQAHDDVPDSKGKGYLINVASNQHGVGYGKWVHIDGWSEAVIRFIQAHEVSTLEEIVGIDEIGRS